MVEINRTNIIHLIRRIEGEIKSEKNFINQLDTEIGDGDHGTNMELSLAEMRHELVQDNNEDIGLITESMGDTFLKVGGGIGTFLYGSSLRKASEKLVGKKTIDMNDFKQILKDMSNEIKELGEVEVGQKTMYDVLVPSLEALLKNQKSENTTTLEELENMALAADQAMLETKNMEAKKGRASYFGEKSIGHIDPGAYSMYLILLTIYEFYKEETLSDLLKSMNY